jgi:tetratricopeptide (TPR) repeat protein
MKKQICLSIAFLGLSFTSFSQNSAVVSAYNYLNDYNRDKANEAESLIKAKESIDKASVNESTSGKPKTWYYRGNVYMALSESKHASHSGMIEDALKTSIESYAKAFKIDPKGEFAEDAKRFVFQGSNMQLNEGVKAYNEKAYDKALVLFESSVLFKKELGIIDTLGMSNCGIAALGAKNYPKAVEIYTQLAQFGGKNGAANYLSLGKAYKALNKQDEAIKTYQEGRAKYPDDAILITEELNIYLVQGKDAEALDMLSMAIAKDPSNAQLHFASGVTFDRLGKKPESEASYKKAIEVKPDYFDAYYNLGALYFNQAKELLDKANAEKDDKKYQAGKKIADAAFENALPYLEKAHQLDPKDVSTMISLKGLYAQLNRMDKFKEIKQKLEP